MKLTNKRIVPFLLLPFGMDGEEMWISSKETTFNCSRVKGCSGSFIPRNKLNISEGEKGSKGGEGGEELSSSFCSLSSGEGREEERAELRDKLIGDWSIVEIGVEGMWKGVGLDRSCWMSGFCFCL